MADLGKYLYCIVRCSEEHTFEDVAPIGNVGGPVQTLSYDGLSAVVSDSPVTEYKSTRANMLAHEHAQERVMQELALLPVRFGTVTRDFDSAIPDIRKLLEKRSQDFNRLLSDMEGKVELGLKALWRDEQVIFEEILTENSRIRRLRNSLRRKPPEVVRFEGIPLGEMVKEALEDKKTRGAATLLAPLRPIAHRTRENKVVVDRMVFNAAFLIDVSQEEKFDRAVAMLDDRWGHRMDLKYTGPNPPWSFVEIVVNWEDL